jgi:predicted PurR-regulated permease PerM
VEKDKAQTQLDEQRRVLSGGQFWLLVGISVAGLVYLLGPVLTPFVLSAAIAYLFDPVVDRMETWSLPRTLAVIFVFLIFGLLLLGFVLLLIPAMSEQMHTAMAEAPKIQHWFETYALPWLREKTGLPLASMSDVSEWLVSQVQGQGDWVSGLMKGIGASSLALANGLANALLVPVVTFYLLRDWDRMVAYVRDLVPRPALPTVSQLAGEADEVLGAFVRGQLMVMLALATIYWIGLTLVGVDLALLVAVVAGLASIVPYLGVILGFTLASVAALLQFQSLDALIGVAVVFTVGQILEGMVLTPWLVGDRIGLHPVTVLFAIMAGGQLMGFTGILIALPVASVLAVILRHMHRKYRGSRYYAHPEERSETGERVAAGGAPGGLERGEPCDKSPAVPGDADDKENAADAT